MTKAAGDHAPGVVRGGSSSPNVALNVLVALLLTLILLMAYFTISFSYSRRREG